MKRLTIKEIDATADQNKLSIVKIAKSESPEKIREGVIEFSNAMQDALAEKNKGEVVAIEVLTYLDDLKDEAAVHIWPDDLENCMCSECAVTVHSVRMGSPEGKTVPLFSRQQVAEALAHTTPQPDRTAELEAEVEEMKADLESYIEAANQYATDLLNAEAEVVKLRNALSQVVVLSSDNVLYEAGIKQFNLIQDKIYKVQLLAQAALAAHKGSHVKNSPEN